MTEKSRGMIWLELLSNHAPLMPGLAPSVRVADSEGIRYVAVVPDPQNHYPRARNGEVGLIEGWTLAKVINETVKADEKQGTHRPIVAVVDVTSQAYGRREEAFGIHQALAGSAAAYASARMAGHPVIALIVGKAMSGAFLAHGYQANELIALDDPKVLIHAMGKQSAARITLRTVEELDRYASKIPPMAYDIKHYSQLGLLYRLLEVSSADAPTESDVALVRQTVGEAIERAKHSDRTLRNRLGSKNRQASLTVREKMRAIW